MPHTNKLKACRRLHTTHSGTFVCWLPSIPALDPRVPRTPWMLHRRAVVLLTTYPGLQFTEDQYRPCILLHPSEPCFPAQTGNCSIPWIPWVVCTRTHKRAVKVQCFSGSFMDNTFPIVTKCGPACLTNKPAKRRITDLILSDGG